VASAPGRITPHRAPPYKELDLRHEFAHLFSPAAVFDSSTHQIVCRLGLRPRPYWGRPRSWISGALFLRGPEGKGKDGRGTDVKKNVQKVFTITSRRKITWLKLKKTLNVLHLYTRGGEEGDRK